MVSEYDTLSDTFPSTVKTIQKHYKIRTAFFLDFRRHGPFSIFSSSYEHHVFLCTPNVHTDGRQAATAAAAASDACSGSETKVIPHHKIIIWWCNLSEEIPSLSASSLENQFW